MMKGVDIVPHRSALGDKDNRMVCKMIKNNASKRGMLC